MENEVKEPAPKYEYVSPDEYLIKERSSVIKHEYYDGFVIAMSGASLKHNQITSTILSEIGTFLKDKPCQILPSEMRVSTPNRNSYVYPDTTIVCGQPKLEDDRFDTLLNPSVLFEILSPSTRGNDFGYKLMYYQTIPTVKEYIIIETERKFVRVVRKQDDGAWKFNDLYENEVLNIETINFSIPVNDIYKSWSL